MSTSEQLVSKLTGDLAGRRVIIRSQQKRRAKRAAHCFAGVAAAKPRMKPPGRWKTLWCLICASVSMTIHPALAQVVLESQADFAVARGDAALGTSATPANMPSIGSLISFGILPIKGVAQATNPAPLPMNPFNFNFLLPLSYLDSQGVTPNQSGQAIPELKLGFVSHPSNTSLQFSGLLDDAATAGTVTGRNTNSLSGSVRIDYVGIAPFPDRSRFIPYISYSPRQIYKDLFGKKKALTQDVTAGVNKLWDFAPDWSRYNDVAAVLPTWETGLQLSVAHRSNNSGASSAAIVVAPSVKWTMTNHVEWPHCYPEMCGGISGSLALNITRRWYDRYQGETERTWDLAPIATIAWRLPDRLVGGAAAKYGSPEVDFQVAYDDLTSTNTADRNKDLSVGVIIRSGMTF